MGLKIYIHIQQDSLIQVRCKRGSAETVKFYRAIAFFTKYYNTWFVSIEDEFAWVNNASKKTNVKALVILMTRTSGALLDVLMEKDEDRGPQNVFNYCKL